MGVINLLDDNTINKIAAGEVIEKPASIVKELVENSIDAGATDIGIDVAGGGIKSIRISDNGRGIAPEDLETAFLRHATSKIRDEGDLYSISTLGFRGEALASIAAVSKVELITRTLAQETGYKLILTGGRQTGIEECGCPVGTIFSVTDVFFNTPARLKFLKSEGKELMAITNVIENMALSNPQVSFKYRVNGKSILSTLGDGDLKSVLLAVYGREVIKNLLPINQTIDFITLSGFIGNSNLQKGTRSSQSIFVNGRFVRNKTITAAVEAAFKSMLMINKFPFFALNLTVNPEFIDVNVHPAKAEVKFQDDQKIFKAVYGTVKEALLSQMDINDEMTEETEKSRFEVNVPKAEFAQEKMELTTLSPSECVPTQAEPFDRLLPTTITETTSTSTSSSANRSMPVSSFYSHSPSTATQNQTSKAFEDSQGILSETNSSPSKSVAPSSIPSADYSSYEKAAAYSGNPAPRLRESRDYFSPSTEQLPRSMKPSTETSMDSPRFEPLKPLGQINQTYIIAEGAGDMYMIDQHAAHERIYYEKYLGQYHSSQIQSQNTLVPIVVELTPSQKSAMPEQQELLERLGYELEDFGGNSIALRAVPVIYGNPDPQKLFDEILADLEENPKELFHTIDKVFYTMACKSAVKAGDKLSMIEMSELLEQLRFCEDPYHCPHGRPTVIKMSFYELEKKFKRIQ